MTRIPLALLLTLILFQPACTSIAVTDPPPRETVADASLSAEAALQRERDLEQVRAVAARPEMIAAFAHIEENRDRILEEWRTITEINAPSGLEEDRARFVQQQLVSYGLETWRDSAGNVIARRKGSGGGPVVVLDAHLDTVFQPGLTIRTEIRNGWIHGPGVGDNSRNIEAILAIARALDAAQIRTRGDLLFLFTVEEESNFRGVLQFIEDHGDSVNHFIALDGGFAGFEYGGIGINWYRHHFIGPGGHTRSATPPYSAALPVGRSIARIYELSVPRAPQTWLNIGMMGGAEVVNAKAEDGWFTVDLRSTDAGEIARLEGEIAAIVSEEARSGGFELRTEVISQRDVAQIPGHRESVLVRTAEAAHIVAGFENPPMGITASNHAIPVLLAKIPAISTGVAPCRDAHALTEHCAIEPIYQGIRKILLLAVALAELQ
jgi:tripeptide aminopeptidase